MLPLLWCSPQPRSQTAVADLLPSALPCIRAILGKKSDRFNSDQLWGLGLSDKALSLNPTVTLHERFNLCVCMRVCVKGWNQGLVHARQVLYH
jgi:hypothetical protein